MSETRKGKRNAFYGKKHSGKTKERISNKLIGRYKGENSPNSKINQKIADEIRLKRKCGYSQKKLSEEYQLSKTQIYAIIRNERWPTKAE